MNVRIVAVGLNNAVLPRLCLTIGLLAFCAPATQSAEPVTEPVQPTETAQVESGATEVENPNTELEEDDATVDLSSDQSPDQSNPDRVPPSEREVEQKDPDAIETFVPTEQIRADFSVSYPVDI